MVYSQLMILNSKKYFPAECRPAWREQFEMTVEVHRENLDEFKACYRWTSKLERVYLSIARFFLPNYFWDPLATLKIESSQFHGYWTVHAMSDVFLYLHE